ncbi:hypothetical protein QTJ16_002331 [Diplocarpon rosae]|uniref:LYC1 C-terminal domain-containing protein n=1 Tax=Diplocarpon rosae TaxID=946125 RepID=A0AAD9T1L6_9HELO|nr:hypothetical protein QTJ16_002331 [Diplocarpon rosae]PBP25612.1 putative Lysine acetyltransferase [Diplocarpon rosae]
MGDNAPANDSTEFPDSKSPSLYLTHPTPEEQLETWKLNSVNWGTALPLPDYLERERYLTTVPLAKDGGMTHWILVERGLPPNKRPILASCESLRKPVLVAKGGIIREGITHGVGSVFGQPKFRGKGYATRMLKELAPVLKTWQVGPTDTVPFSILYSDIGTKYYAKLGWATFPSTHISFPPAASAKAADVTPLTYPDLPALCAEDEECLRRALEAAAKDGKTHVALIPNHDCMQWHHMREDFVASRIFGKTPAVKGALIGEPGSRVWAIWTRAFYGPLNSKSGNTLHILRLVIEDEADTEENAQRLKGILAFAQSEAKEWQLNAVDVWNPSDTLKKLVKRTAIEAEFVVRDKESIASLMWYGDGEAADVNWVWNEKFGWC